MPSYDNIGTGYNLTRRSDPRIAERINLALGTATSILNVGAGAGSYEPVDRQTYALEPSITMIRQRAASAAPVVQGHAEQLPFASQSVDAALAVLTVHHWPDRKLGLEEMRRVARDRVVILTWDQQVWESFWLVDEYFPCIKTHDRPRAVAVADVTGPLGAVEVVTVPIPADCVDGFHGAFWRRPQAYLDARIRAGISTYALMSEGDLQSGLARLEADLGSGAWQETHQDLLGQDELDLGYRLIIAGS